MIHAQIVRNCNSNDECIKSFGSGSCCLYEDNRSVRSLTCQSSAYLLNIFNSSSYEKSTRSYYNATMDNRVIAFCEDFEKEDSFLYPSLNPKVFEYTYVQPYKTKLNVNKRDAQHPYIDSNMYYIPKKVNSWSDWFEKWRAVFIPQFVIIFDPLVISAALLSWLLDNFLLTWTTPRYKFFPSMYTNPLAELVLSYEEAYFGPFIYYDMFSVYGLFQYYLERFWFNCFFFVEVGLAIVRGLTDNWRLMDLLELHPVDMNYDFIGIGDNDELYIWTAILDTITFGVFKIPIWTVSIIARAFNYIWVSNVTRFNSDHWENHRTNPTGVDCNGNTGPGFYCFCPSQGYLCGCKHESYAKKLECYDHQGYDCLGNLIDGETQWCLDKENFFYNYNLEFHNLD